MTFFLFPGQGSQTPGMGKDFFDNSPPARAIFDQAAGLSGTDFLRLLFEGPADELTLTSNAQPALLATEVAIARHLESKGVIPNGCAGHSLGEIPALVIAGALDFADAFRLTQVRARLMSENVPEGGMAAVMGLAPEKIEAALPRGAQVANYNGPGQTIISGTKEAVKQAEDALKAAGAKRVMPLKVSGPFHSSLMAPAAERFAQTLAETPFQTPERRFISSVTAQEESAPERLRDLLREQLTAPVQWTAVMGMVGAGPCVEVGPGKVLQGLARRIDGAPEVELAGTLEAADALTN